MKCINNHHTAHKSCHVCRYIAERTRAIEVQPMTDKEQLKLHIDLILRYVNTEYEHLLEYLPEWRLNFTLYKNLGKNTQTI